MGMDGKPRAINIEHGKNVIQWNRNKEYCLENLENLVELIDEGDGCYEERNGLNKNEFIETHHHWFSKPVFHFSGDSVNVLNLIEGVEVIVESPSGLFASFIVHYAENLMCRKL